MFGSKTYELPLARDYVAHWGMAEAIRELIQNALDSESPFEYDFVPTDSTKDEGNRWTLKLTSEFATLAPRTLLLGTTSKRESQDTIGSFGEGYKIAMLVLTRLGYKMEMLNGQVSWIPQFRHSRQFDDEVLAVDECPLPDKTNKGLTVLVHGLTDDERMQIEDSCLKMQSEVGNVKETKYGRVLMERSKLLYVGSLFVCKTNFRYGYDIKPEYLKLERDRQTVSDWDLGSVTLDMLLECFPYGEVAKMILEDVPDTQFARWNMPQLLKEEIYKQWRENNKSKLVAQNQEELKNLVHQGFQVVHVSPTIYNAVTASEHYKKEAPRMKTQPPKEMLRAWFAKHSTCLTAEATTDWAEIIMAAQFWEVK